jgi:hypothetical protein
MIGQHHLLNDVADLVDKGVLRTTLDQSFGTINAANLKRAHALLESGQSRGKIVLEGWLVLRSERVGWAKAHLAPCPPVNKSRILNGRHAKLCPPYDPRTDDQCRQSLFQCRPYESRDP